MPPRKAANQTSLSGAFRVSKKDDNLVKQVDEQVDQRPPGFTVEKLQHRQQPKEASPNLPKLDTKLLKYREYADKIRQRELSEPIHQENVDPVEVILKDFDFTTEYGPVAGLSRLARWQRVQRLGMDPPGIIKEILETQQGVDDTKYSQSYLYGHV